MVSEQWIPKVLVSCTLFSRARTTIKIYHKQNTWNIRKLWLSKKSATHKPLSNLSLSNHHNTFDSYIPIYIHSTPTQEFKLVPRYISSRILQKLVRMWNILLFSLVHFPKMETPHISLNIFKSMILYTTFNFCNNEKYIIECQSPCHTLFYLKIHLHCM